MAYDKEVGMMKRWWYQASDWVAAHPKTVMVIALVIIIAAFAV